MMDKLITRCKIYVNCFCMFKSDVELVSHLLIHCSVAKEKWHLIFALFRMTWIVHGDVAWSAWSGSWAAELEDRGGAWLLPLCHTWMIQIARNRISFQGVEGCVHWLRSNFLFIFCSYISGKGPKALIFCGFHFHVIRLGLFCANGPSISLLVCTWVALASPRRFINILYLNLL